ncbi:MAG: hypothetical protein ABI637_11825 [Gemmatimonadota bacterium]
MSFDTTPEAELVQLNVYRRLSGVERLRLALELSELARKLAVAGIRQRQPGATAAEIVRELSRLG